MQGEFFHPALRSKKQPPGAYEIVRIFGESRQNELSREEHAKIWQACCVPDGTRCKSLNETFVAAVGMDGDFAGIFEFADHVDDFLLDPFDVRRTHRSEKFHFLLQHLGGAF